MGAWPDPGKCVQPIFSASVTGKQRLDLHFVYAVNLCKAGDSFGLGQSLRAAERIVGVVLDDPNAELAPNLGFANALDDFDARLAQDANPRAIDAWMRVPHANDDPSEPPRCDRPGARRRAPMERARLERGVERCPDHAIPARLGVSRSGNLGVVFTRTERVPAAEQRAIRGDDHAADPGIVSRRAPGKLCLGDCHAHPVLIVSTHPSGA